MAMMGLSMGGHIRVGMEDNIYYQRGVLALSMRSLSSASFELPTNTGGRSQRLRRPERFSDFGGQNERGT